VQVVFQVRAAEPADVEAIVDLYLASWRAGYKGLLPDDVLETQVALRRSHDWLGAIESPSAAVILGMNGGHVAGVVEAREELSEAERDLPEVTMLYVAPSSWGSPLAKELLTAGSSWIADRGHGDARLRVIEKQARARRFYEREGWTVDDNIRPESNGFFRLIYYRRRLGRGLE
jgi:GNAT superfamily N-acetyltransferase